MRNNANKIYAAIILALVTTLTLAQQPASANPQAMPFSPGENLKYKMRYDNIPAGEIVFEVKPMETIRGTEAYHFVMTTKSNGFVDMFYKIRERIDAYADPEMTRSILFKKRQTEGKHKRDVTIDFDWRQQTARYTNFDVAHPPIDLAPGSLDPLSAFYYTRLAIHDETSRMERPVTDGKRNFMGSASVVRREQITLSNGSVYDTYCLVPDMGLFGEVSKTEKTPTLFLWVTADDKRIPVRIQTKVKVGQIIGELDSAEL